MICVWHTYRKFWPGNPYRLFALILTYRYRYLQTPWYRGLFGRFGKREN